MGEQVKVSSENVSGDLPCVLFKHPSSKAGIVVLQEWWGMNQQIQDMGQEIGEKGRFTTIVPDLYRGKQAIDAEEAGHLMSGLDWPGAVKDIQACCRYLLKRGCTKIGVTGFCMGGALTIAASCMVPEVSAGVVYYGIPSKELCDPSTIKIPLQCHFGVKDHVVGFSSAADAKKLKEVLDAGNVNCEFYNYDAGHAFTNVTAETFDQKTCDQAMQRMYAFFQKYLK